MRFAHHLSSHLTPEWRKHYIDYDNLKGRIYEMIGQVPRTVDEDDTLESRVQSQLARYVQFNCCDFSR